MKLSLRSKLCFYWDCSPFSYSLAPVKMRYYFEFGHVRAYMALGNKNTWNHFQLTKPFNKYSVVIIQPNLLSSCCVRL